MAWTECLNVDLDRRPSCKVGTLGTLSIFAIFLLLLGVQIFIVIADAGNSLVKLIHRAEKNINDAFLECFATNAVT